MELLSVHINSRFSVYVQRHMDVVHLGFWLAFVTKSLYEFGRFQNSRGLSDVRQIHDDGAEN